MESTSSRGCKKALTDWIKWLNDNHCFSPEEYDRPLDHHSNIKCYISCPGNSDGGVSEMPNFKNILRFTPSQKGGSSPVQVLAKLISNSFGAELMRFCHFGAESSILERLLERLTSMKIDLRSLLFNAPIYDSKKHLESLGLQHEFPGLCKSGYDKPDFFMKLGVWKSGSGAVASEGASVNMWALLTAASLVGSRNIHCKASSKIAHSIMSLILQCSPVNATPGNMIPVRSFEEVSRDYEVIHVSSENRPRNFLRPIFDSNFAINNVYSCCPLLDDDMPEDYLGFGYVRSMSKFLNCEYHEVPPAFVLGHYQLMSRTYYSIYSQKRLPDGGMEVKCGNLYIREDRKVTIELSDQVLDCDIHNWEEVLRLNNFLVLPTIFRKGALVSVPDNDDDVGCLVPVHEFVEGGPLVTNYDHLKWGYHALVQEGVKEFISVKNIYASLIQPGAELWIKPGSETWVKLQGKFPACPLSAQRQKKRMVRVLLNVPTDVNLTDKKEVCVTVVSKKNNGFQAMDLSVSNHYVHPWELSRVGPVDKDLEVLILMT